MNQILLASLRLSFIMLFFSIFPSCQNDKESVLSDLEKQQKWSKEIYNSMKQIYLWNDALPATFVSTKFSNANDAMDYLCSFKINAETNKPIDKYSFIDEIGNLSGQIQGGVANGDYGFMVQSSRNANNEVAFFVTYVYKNSPAGKAGINRSYEIIKINGSTDVHPEVGDDGYLVATSTAYISMVNALFNSQTATFTFKKNTGEVFDATLSSSGSYAINSILYDSIYNVGSKKVGYMVFNEFLGKPSQTELTSVIANFKANGVKQLIVDLRYNGGGSVQTCEILCNMLAPLSSNGKLMYKYKYNAKLTEAYKNDPSIKAYFKISNSLEPASIYFIVSRNTASASELLINNLRPYFQGNLFLIGSTTYGKPCGFWAVPIGYTNNQKTTKEGYDLYAVSFETQNANGEGNYYAGMKPGTADYPGVITKDYIDLAWGDTKDACLTQAFNHISTGAFLNTAQQIKSIQNFEINNQLNPKFKGMIDFR